MGIGNFVDQHLGRFAEAIDDEEIVVAATEYGALRQEIVLRLQAQQNLIQYTVIVAGLPIPLLAAILQASNAGIPLVTQFFVVMALLLAPPVVCVFLQMVYLKQHLYLSLMALYIQNELGPTLFGRTRGLHTRFPIAGPTKNELPERLLIFSGWEDHLTDSAMNTRGAIWLSRLLAVAEGEFPAIAGFVYLGFGLLIYLETIGHVTVAWYYPVLFWVVFFATVLATAVAAGAGFFLQAWVRTRRNESRKSRRWARASHNRESTSP